MWSDNQKVMGDLELLGVDLMSREDTKNSYRSRMIVLVRIFTEIWIAVEGFFRVHLIGGTECLPASPAHPTPDTVKDCPTS